MSSLLGLQMAKPLPAMRAGLGLAWRRRARIRRIPGVQQHLPSYVGFQKIWGLRDSYYFISRFFSALVPSKNAGSSFATPAPVAAIARRPASGALELSCDPSNYPYIQGIETSGARTGTSSTYTGRVVPRLSRLSVDNLRHDPPRVFYSSHPRWRGYAPTWIPESWPMPDTCTALSGCMASFKTEQRRGFRDYFIMHIPGSSIRKADPPTNPSSTPQTTVRIPLRSAKYYFGVTLARGNRPYNEDAYQAGVIDIPNFSPIQAADTIELDNTDDELAVGPDQEPAVFYFGVFDGHGGDEASSFLKNYMHRYIEESSKLLNPENRQQPAVLTSSRDDPLAIQVLAVEESPEEIEAREKRKHMQTELVNTWKDTVGGYFRRFKPDFGGVKRCGRGGDFGIESVLMYAFLKADLDFITSTRPWFLSPYEPEPVGKSGPGEPRKSGSTATVVLLSTSTRQPFWNRKQTSTMVVAHLGDTRAILCRVSDGHAVPLTTNHHPGMPSESARLRRYATAFVSDAFGEERFGVLANTRSVGDVAQKRLGVTAEPEILARELLPEEYSFLVLVSDGVSAVLGDQEIVDVVKECRTPQEAGKELVEFVDEVGEIGDNATAMVVRLGGWDRRAEGGEGWNETKALREWRRAGAEERGGRRRM